MKLNSLGVGNLSVIWNFRVKENGLGWASSLKVVVTMFKGFNHIKYYRQLIFHITASFDERNSNIIS